MISGSVEPSAGTKANLFPNYLFDREKMWTRYLAAKYQDTAELISMAWGSPGVSFRKIPLTDLAPSTTKLWKEFLKETEPPVSLQFLGFLRPSTRMPSYSARQFRIWLLNQYGNDLLRMNEDLGTQFARLEAVQPPRSGLVGPSRPLTPLQKRLDEFMAMQPPERLIPWNVGGFFRAVYLPTIYGPNVTGYNVKYCTTYASYEEVPFSSTAPEIGREDWFRFVSRILCPDFVVLTSTGEAAQKAAGIGRLEFIPTMAAPEDVKVNSLDVSYSEWAAVRGVTEARIPQRALDREAFEKEELFWKWQFLVLNYQRVLDDILLHGRAISNTLILVVLSVAGALIVNPLAAYALSRFKLRKTYHILLFCLATIAFPAEVTMIPVFLQMKEFHLLNTFGALVLPSLASGFSIFLLKGFFDSLPKELYEAAELDGAGEWTMFWQITMNLSRPILAVIALGAFTAAYGTFFYALILAPDPKMWTLMVYIFQLRSGADYPVVYASLIIAAIPTLLVFVLCQNIILRGIVVPSDK
ncbi:MAG: carbohydrate ABC transporter permease [Verrucomicrobiota bacterium]